MLATALQAVLRQSGHTVRALARSDFDIVTDPVDALDLSGIDYVVNATGVINRRMNDPAATVPAYLVNSLFPHLLADHCERHHVRLVHVSTDCVFDGTAGPRTERDRPTPKDLYGRTKQLGEPANCLVLRTSMIGPEQQNHYSLLCWVLAQHGECPGFTNHVWNGMTTVQLSRCIERVISRDLYQSRAQHLHSEDVTKAELLRKIAAAFDHPIRVIPTESPTPRDMRLTSIDPAFVEAMDIPTLDEQLRELATWCDPRGNWLGAAAHQRETSVSLPENR